MMHQARRLGPVEGRGGLLCGVTRLSPDEGAVTPFTIPHDTPLLLSVERHGKDKRGSTSRPVRSAVPPARRGRRCRRQGRRDSGRSRRWRRRPGGRVLLFLRPSPGAVSVLLDREMDNAVVGETEEEGDEEEDGEDGTLQDSLRMARAPFTPRRGGGRPDTPARELRRRAIAAGSRGRGVLGH